MDYISLLKNRFACKEFNNQKIPQHLVNTIVQAGILSPSSLGLEPWKFYVLSSKEKLEKLKNFCNSKLQFETCSHAIIIAGKTNFNTSNFHIKKSLSRRADYEKIIQIYGPFLNNLNENQARNYTIAQSHLAACNIVNCAYSLGVDSCIIGGFNETPINEMFLKQDEICSLIITLGYRKNQSINKKMRFSFNDQVEFI